MRRRGAVAAPRSRHGSGTEPSKPAAAAKSTTTAGDKHTERRRPARLRLVAEEAAAAHENGVVGNRLAVVLSRKQ